MACGWLPPGGEFSSLVQDQALAAEVKEFRVIALLIVLVTTGWLLPRLFNKDLVTLDLVQILNLNHRAPSLFHAGLGNVTPPFWIEALAAAALVENRPGEFLNENGRRRGAVPARIGFI